MDLSKYLPFSRLSKICQNPEISKIIQTGKPFFFLENSPFSERTINKVAITLLHTSRLSGLAQSLSISCFEFWLFGV